MPLGLDQPPGPDEPECLIKKMARSFGEVVTDLMREQMSRSPGEVQGKPGMENTNGGGSAGEYGGDWSRNRSQPEGATTL